MIYDEKDGRTIKFNVSNITQREGVVSNKSRIWERSKLLFVISNQKNKHMEKQAKIKFYILSILLAGLMGCTVKNQKVDGKSDNAAKVSMDSTKMHE